MSAFYWFNIQSSGHETRSRVNAKPKIHNCQREQDPQLQNTPLIFIHQPSEHAKRPRPINVHETYVAKKPLLDAPRCSFLGMRKNYTRVGRFSIIVARSIKDNLAALDLKSSSCGDAWQGKNSPSPLAQLFAVLTAAQNAVRARSFRSHPPPSAPLIWVLYQPRPHPRNNKFHNCDSQNQETFLAQAICCCDNYMAYIF